MKNKLLFLIMAAVLLLTSLVGCRSGTGSGTLPYPDGWVIRNTDTDESDESKEAHDDSESETSDSQSSASEASASDTSDPEASREETTASASEASSQAAASTATVEEDSKRTLLPRDPLLSGYLSEHVSFSGSNHRSFCG